MKQLISQTSTIQSLFVTTENNIKQANNEAADMVKKLSQRVGYATVQQYCEAGLLALTPAQKAHYKQMTDALVRHNEPLKNTQLAFGALGALGTFLKIGGK